MALNDTLPKHGGLRYPVLRGYAIPTLSGRRLIHKHRDLGHSACSRCNKISRKGFTLIEILVSSAILVLLASGFLGLQYIVSKNQTTAWSNYQSIEDANAVVASISKELRNASQSETGSFFLETTGDQEIIFYSDYDLDEAVERIRYSLSGNSLIKGIIEPQGDPAIYDPATENQRSMTDIVRNGPEPVFYYYNSGWPVDTINNPLAEVDRIAETSYIGITLVSNPNQNQPDFDYTIESNVKLRSL